MDEPLDELYFIWLYEQIGRVGTTKSRTHWSLSRQLFEKEFTWFVPNDDNRVEDGRDLRYQFVNEEGIQGYDPAWIDMGCSMFEMLIALSRVLSFETEGEPRDWFWHLLNNLQLSGFNDRIHTQWESSVDAILDRVISRTYLPDGSGGLFPLENPKEDQRSVEIWYQLNAYLIERDD